MIIILLSTSFMFSIYSSNQSTYIEFYVAIKASVVDFLEFIPELSFKEALELPMFPILPLLI